MKKLILIFAVIALPLLAGAQHSSRNGDVESFKIAWITEKLDLSAEEAKIFWPIYNDYNRELNTLRKNHANKLISFRKITEINELSDAEVQILITSELDYKQREVNIEKRYYEKFKSSLPIKTLAKFYRAQETFKKELLNRYRPRN
ncbi:hypothetical protein [Pedobacter flavus]|uniref:Sensor of ECF-type sigma factor n=1 Tax=Pedobacter flavus TaxID=3113906 RepID=A0ABU7H1S0_9SPHI|nr:hypothetical protein [Pedobacter sp. VNH31]MEE1885168.1 hypothetical protein [Pedobacter sp. VNH31]